MSQELMIRSALDRGMYLTPKKALERFGCFRLAARIHDLRSTGYPVEVQIIERDGKRFAQYRKGRK